MFPRPVASHLQASALEPQGCRSPACRLVGGGLGQAQALVFKEAPGGSPGYPSENHCSKPGEAKPTLLLMPLRHQPWPLLQKELHPLKSLALFPN